MKLKQLSIMIPNQPGALVRICEILQKAQINISTLTLADTADFGILRLIIKDWEAAKNALESNALVVKVSDVLAISIPNEPGGLLGILNTLNSNKINVEYMYGFSLATGKQSVQIFRLNDPDHAIDILNKAHICVLDSGELFGN